MLFEKYLGRLMLNAYPRLAEKEFLSECLELVEKTITVAPDDIFVLSSRRFLTTHLNHPDHFILILNSVSNKNYQENYCYNNPPWILKLSTITFVFD